MATGTIDVWFVNFCMFWVWSDPNGKPSDLLFDGDPLCLLKPRRNTSDAILDIFDGDFDRDLDNLTGDGGRRGMSGMLVPSSEPVDLLVVAVDIPILVIVNCPTAGDVPVMDEKRLRSLCSCSILCFLALSMLGLLWTAGGTFPGLSVIDRFGLEVI